MSTQFGGQDEKAFLERIRSRMNRQGPPPAHPGSSVWPEDHEARITYEEKAAMFTSALEGLGGRVLRAKDALDAYRVAADALADVSTKRVLVEGGDWSACESVLADLGIAVDRWDDLDFGHGSEDRSLDRVNAWDAGLGWADYAVADLGSLALLFNDGRGRSVSVVPPRYIAFVARDALVYSRRTVLEDVSRRFRERGGAPSLAFVTGPSRSADIEMDLSVGVHGPGEVWAVLVEDERPPIP